MATVEYVDVVLIWQARSKVFKLYERYNKVISKFTSSDDDDATAIDFKTYTRSVGDNISVIASELRNVTYEIRSFSLEENRDAGLVHSSIAYLTQLFLAQEIDNREIDKWWNKILHYLRVWADLEEQLTKNRFLYH